MTKGLSKVEVVQVAESLQPLESVMAVPERKPFVTVDESGTFWQEVADAATSIDPILRPSYLPPTITQVWVPNSYDTTFRVVCSDRSGQTRITVSGGAVNPAMPGPNSLIERVRLRGVQGNFRLRDKAEPLGTAFVYWEEPGRLGEPGRPDGPHLDHVTYMVSATDLSKEELLRVANSLEPFDR